MSTLSWKFLERPIPYLNRRTHPPLLQTKGSDDFMHPDELKFSNLRKYEVKLPSRLSKGSYFYKNFISENRVKRKFREMNLDIYFLRSTSKLY